MILTTYETCLTFLGRFCCCYNRMESNIFYDLLCCYIGKVSLIKCTDQYEFIFFPNTGSTSRKNSLELIELSSINKVSLV